MGVSGVIVVGVDGSETSHAALRWAAEEARLRSARLVAVYAWSFIPPQPIGDPGMLAVSVGDLPGQLDAESEAARVVLDDAVSGVLGSDPRIDVEPKLVERDAGDALVAESADADLVVVGSHGRSGLTAALLGSVSRHVVDHSKCPVVVVKQAKS
jgi:nucleotide-binding universal stress UspA family protein